MPSAPSDQNAARRAAILRSAAGVFLRYGYKKTSMDDLAREAGLSRQGLYLHFARKEAIFHDAVVLLADHSLKAARAALACAGRTIDARLLDAFTGLVSNVDGSSMSREHLIELTTTAAALAGPVVAAFDEALLDELARALRASGVAAAWKAEGLSAKTLARHLVVASRGIKQSARTDADYREQMRVAVRVICRGHDGKAAT
jgi:AcrR family transcriptional regulator